MHYCIFFVYSRISLTVCGRQHFFISFFTPKKAKSKDFFGFRVTQNQMLKIKAPSGSPRVLSSQGFYNQARRYHFD